MTAKPKGQVSFFITITFDLHDAGGSPYGNGVYTKIGNALDQKLFKKSVYSSKHKSRRKLPANTYVREFKGNDRASKVITNLVATFLKQIFKQHQVHGTFFIVTGKKWAWKGGIVV